MKTIEDVARFLGVSPKNKIKTLALMANEVDAKTRKAKPRPVILLMRGDHQMNEAKLSTAVGGRETVPCRRRKSSRCFIRPRDFWDRSASTGPRAWRMATSRS